MQHQHAYFEKGFLCKCKGSMLMFYVNIARRVYMYIKPWYIHIYVHTLTQTYAYMCMCAWNLTIQNALYALLCKNQMIRVFRRDTLLLSFASKQMHRGLAAFWVCLPFSPARRNKTYETWRVLGLAMRATTHYTCMIPGVFIICTPINVSRYNKYLYYIYIPYMIWHSFGRFNDHCTLECNMMGVIK